MNHQVCTGPGGRGCPCDYHAVRKASSREHARRRRARDLEARNRNAGRICQKRFGPGRCGGVLEAVTVDGTMVMQCPLCERARQRICRDCPRPVHGNGRLALRCAEHREVARQTQIRASQERHRTKRNAESRARAQQPDVQRRNAEYKKAYRKAHPDKVREWKRAYVKKFSSDKRSTYIDYHRRYNAQAYRIQSKRAKATAAYYRDNPVRPTPKCQHCKQAIAWTPKPGGRSGRPPINCDNCCTKAELTRRIKCRAIAATRGVTLTFVALPLGHRPIRVRRPQPARYAETGERLCATPDCQIVVTKRKKKCSRCRAAETEHARQQLEASQGRGRRTDLGAAEPRRKSGLRPKPIAAAPIAHVEVLVSRPAMPVSPLAVHVDAGLTTRAIAELVELDEAAVLSQLKLAGGDLFARACANNTRAEKAKRSIARANIWAKPREQQVVA